MAIDLYCGLGGWTEGLLAAGYDVIGFDNERHEYGEHRYPAQLVLQDVRTIDGSRFAGVDLIVASPPCTEFSYMAMPWSRAKAIARALRGCGEFPDGYTGSRTLADLTELFDACFRIQREASAAAGRLVPLVVENVKGAQPWIGQSRWHFGSFHLWGDVPALMPAARKVFKNAGGSWFRVSHNNVEHSRGDAIGHTPHMTNPAEHGIKQGGTWWHDENSMSRKYSSKSPKRKAASAMIAKIPLDLSLWIGRAWLPPKAA